MRTRWKRWVAALLLALACLGAPGGAAWADDGPGKPVTVPPPVESQLDPAVRSVPTILKPQGAQGSEANSPGGSAVVGSQGQSDGSAKSGGLGSKLWGWAKDHGMGLLMGIGVGVVIAGAILLAPIVLPALAMSTAVLLAGTALTSAGLYGLMTGAERFSVTECVVLTGISVLSVVAGSGMAAVGLGARALKWGKVALNALEGGVANAASYLITDPHPTALSALQRFGVGMVFATGFMAAGNAVSKAYAAYKAARGLSHVPLEGLAGQLEGGAARAEAVVGGTSRAAVLERTQAMFDREALRARWTLVTLGKEACGMNDEERRQVEMLRSMTLKQRFRYLYVEGHLFRLSPEQRRRGRKAFVWGMIPILTWAILHVLQGR